MLKPKQKEIIDVYEVKVGKVKQHLYKHRNKYAVISGVLAGVMVNSMLSKSNAPNAVVRHLISFNSPVTNNIINVISDSERGDSSIDLGSQEKQTL